MGQGVPSAAIREGITLIPFLVREMMGLGVGRTGTKGSVCMDNLAGLVANDDRTEQGLTWSSRALPS